MYSTKNIFYRRSNTHFRKFFYVISLAPYFSQTYSYLLSTNYQLFTKTCYTYCMKKTVLALFMALLFGSFAVSANAADDLDIAISPPILDITALQPSQVSTKITLQNMNENSHDFTIVIQPFKQSTENNGALEYVDVFNGPDPFIRQKITFFDQDSEVTKIHLGPLESKALTMKLDIGKDDKSGDYYFSVIFMTTKESDSAQTTVRLPSGIATNVLLSLGKPGSTTGSIDSFMGPLFIERGPVDFKILLSNTSDHFILPTGNVTLKNIFGQTVGKVDILPQYVLSQTKRYLTDKQQSLPSDKQSLQSSPTAAGLKSKVLDSTQSIQSTPRVVWPEKALLGLYSATVNIALSENGPIVKRQIVFLAFPLIPALATALIITILLGIYLRVKKLL